PVADLAVLRPKRNPAIPLPADIYPNRRNSAGVDLADPRVREPLLAGLKALEAREWAATPTVLACPSTSSERAGSGGKTMSARAELVEARLVRSPQDNKVIVGHAIDTTPADIAL